MSYSKKTSKFNKKLAGKTVRVQEKESGRLFHIRILSVNRGYFPGNIIFPALPEAVVYYRNNPERTVWKQNWYVVFKDLEYNQTSDQFVDETTLKKFVKQKP